MDSVQETLVSQTRVQRLKDRIQSTVLVPGDTGYDDARKAWNLTVDQHPAIIVIASDASDIREAVRFAHDNGLGIAVQGTGHGTSRLPDDNMLIVTSRMTAVHIDPESQTARIEAGSIWGPVLEKAQAVGLAPLLGSSPGVGVVGYTLGGGAGWLARKYGLSTDSVRAFELVTADGQLLRASPTENPDLFWALRGAGAAFGVITAVEVQLYPVTTIYGGNLFYPIELGKEVFTRYREWIASAPNELSSGIAIMNIPPLPMFPEFLQGRSVVVVRGCYCGPVEKGEALIQEWRNWKQPLADLFGVMPFAEAGMISQDPMDPVAGFATGGLWLRELSDETIDVVLRYAAGNGLTNEGPSPILQAEIRHLGGAVASVAADANAFSHRGSSLLLAYVSMCPTPEVQRFLEQYSDQFEAALQPYLAPGVYINFVEGKKRWAHTKDAYSPDTYRRLTALKARYDPDNRFRFGLDIPPVAQ